MSGKWDLFISLIRKSLFRASPHPTSILVPSERHFVSDNNHLLWPLGPLRHHCGWPLQSNVASRRMAACDRGAICEGAEVFIPYTLLPGSGAEAFRFLICISRTNGLSPSHLCLFWFVKRMVTCRMSEVTKILQMETWLCTNGSYEPGWEDMDGSKGIKGKPEEKIKNVSVFIYCFMYLTFESLFVFLRTIEVGSDEGI